MTEITISVDDTTGGNHGHINSMLADAFLDLHAPDDWFRLEFDLGSELGPIKVLHSERVNELAGEVVDFIAHLVSGIIDIGSERDAVNENDDLYRVIMNELSTWTEIQGR